MSKKREVKWGPERLRCPSCGAARDAKDRFCRQCGAALSREVKTNGPLRGLSGLRAFGLAVVALAALYALFYYGRRGAPETAAPAQPISIGEVGAPAPVTGAAPATPLEGADQLFNEAMAAYETGDSTSARQFIPMAIMAYQRLDSVSLDSRYHLALLNLAAGRPEDALAQTDTMLGLVPDHLLALTAAAQALDRLERTDEAVELYRRFLDAYTPEAAAARSEYMDHGRALPARREEARDYLREHGPPARQP